MGFIFMMECLVSKNSDRRSWRSERSEQVLLKYSNLAKFNKKQPAILQAVSVKNHSGFGTVR